MSIERLEEIKRQSEYIELSNAENFIVYQDMKIKKEHYDWLIEQAERVKDLEENLEHGAKVAVKTAEKLHYEQQQNKRYRETIEKAIKDLEEDINIVDCARNAHYRLSKALEREE